MQQGLAKLKVAARLAFPHRTEAGPAERQEFWRQARDLDFAGHEAWQSLIDRHLETPAGR